MLMELTETFLPLRFAFKQKVSNNPVEQLRSAGGQSKRSVEPLKQGRMAGWFVTDGSDRILVTRSPGLTAPCDAKLLVQGLVHPPRIEADLRHGFRWRESSPPLSTGEQSQRTSLVLDSWVDAFRFRTEEVVDGIVRPGLRTPQVGALHAALSHWTLGDEVGTVVMPTGTGKTDTMVAILVNRRISRLLVIVPTDALRDQLAGKFLTLGVLFKAQVLDASALFPAVGRLQKSLKTVDEADAFLSCCNVVVSTMAVLRHCPQVVVDRLVDRCGGLFLDEAHHTPAATWNALREAFSGRNKPILQFTATPFRNDKRYIGGRTIYQYPLHKAQAAGYFAPINFISVWDFNRDDGDRKVAMKAIQVLKADVAAGFDHLLMARAASIPRAEALLVLYQDLTANENLDPIIVHSQLASVDKKLALKKLGMRTSRIIVCVDMLGEGFDLPQLKVSALHDIHKSLAVTLQFVGRFTRAAKGLGNATIVANAALAEVGEALENLYASDADWNVLLNHLSDGENAHQRRRFVFLNDFEKTPSGVPIHVIRPKMSTVVYKTSCKTWKPDLPDRFFKKAIFVLPPTVNLVARVLLYVTREETPVRWGDTKSVFDIENNLFLIHWDEAQGLLYINSTDTSSAHQDLAEAIAGAGAQLIRGEIVYRTLHNLKRLVLTNLGLTHLLSRSTRHSNFTGADVRVGLKPSRTANRRKSNLFSIGYEGGERQTLGASQKGRIWAMRVADDIPTWIEWCQRIGGKLSNPAINTDHIIEQAILPQTVTERPSTVALSVEWSDYFYQRSEESVVIEVAGNSATFVEAELEVSGFDPKEPLRFLLKIPGQSAEYEVVFEKDKVKYVALGKEANITASRRTRPASEWFVDHPPLITFADLSFLDYNELYVPNDAARVFDKSSIQSWDWSGCDITIESQYSQPPQVEYRANSVQANVIARLLADPLDYDVLFDDDGSGEIADIVAIKGYTDELVVHLFHCKWSHEERAGARVSDLYEVCGQAQKSVHWKHRVDRIFDHLARRDAVRLKRTGHTRFAKGSSSTLLELKRQNRAGLRPLFGVWLVQPGLSGANVSPEQLDLLGATELFLLDTHEVTLTVVGS